MFTAVWVDWRRRLAIVGVALWRLPGWESAPTSSSTRCAETATRLLRRPRPSVVVHEQQPAGGRGSGLPRLRDQEHHAGGGRRPGGRCGRGRARGLPLDGRRRRPGGGHAGERRRLGLGDRRGEPDGATRRSSDPDHELDATPGLTADALDALEPDRLGRPRTTIRPSRLGPRPRPRGFAPCGSAAGTRRSCAAAIERAAARRSVAIRRSTSSSSARRSREFAMPAAAWAARSGDPVSSSAGHRAEAHAGRASPRQGGARLRARAAVGDLGQGAGAGGQGDPRPSSGSGRMTRRRTRSTSRATSTGPSAGTSTTPATAS